MKELYERNKLFFLILFVAAGGFLAWYFSNILSYLLIAVVVSLIGQPLVRLFDRIHIGKLRFPHVLSVILTLVVFLAVVAGVISFFIPLIVTEAQLISSIDMNTLQGHYAGEIDQLEEWLLQMGIIKEKLTLPGMLQNLAMRFLTVDLFSVVLSDVFSITGTLFFDLFSVLFISFFFLTDPHMSSRIVLTILPERYEDRARRVMDKSRKLLSRYFIGICLDVVVMTVSYAIGLSLVGIKGALVIAFFAGIINIIPYIGPVIGTAMGVILGITSMVSAGHYGMIGETALLTVAVFAIVILIDNIVFQPLIYGKSVKAHPMEIFLVIIAAGSVGGIVGMIIAVPVYTFLRIIAQEFFSQFRAVRSLTERM